MCFVILQARGSPVFSPRRHCLLLWLCALFLKDLMFHVSTQAIALTFCPFHAADDGSHQGFSPRGPSFGVPQRSPWQRNQALTMRL